MNHVITFHTHTRPSVEDIRDALKAPVPHAAEVSAIVARLWHLGMAEDAERRARRYEGGLYLYFDRLATKYSQAAEKVTR